uniref:ESAT-6-like protein n=1 Tax=Rhabditophanes sp. KR3021 TaxID=114890 RepID=A0AC35UCI1_9BILA
MHATNKSGTADFYTLLAEQDKLLCDKIKAESNKWNERAKKLSADAQSFMETVKTAKSSMQGEFTAEMMNKTMAELKENYLNLSVDAKDSIKQNLREVHDQIQQEISKS